MLFCKSHKSAPYVKHRRLDNPGKMIYQRIDWMDADFNASLQLIVKNVWMNYSHKISNMYLENRYGGFPFYTSFKMLPTEARTNDMLSHLDIL